MNKQPQNNAEWYDRSLAYILNQHLPQDIPWPLPPEVLHPRDIAYPDFQP